MAKSSKQIIHLSSVITDGVIKVSDGKDSCKDKGAVYVIFNTGGGGGIGKLVDVEVDEVEEGIG